MTDFKTLEELKRLNGLEEIANYMRISESKLVKVHLSGMKEAGAVITMSTKPGQAKYWAWGHRVDLYMHAYNQRVGPL